MRVVAIKIDAAGGVIESKINKYKTNEACVFDVVPYPIVMLVKKMAEEALERRQDEAIKTVAKSIRKSIKCSEGKES